jgi:glucose/arabinose dehydrogenase
MRRSVAAAAAALALVPGCGGDDDGERASPPTVEKPPARGVHTPARPPVRNRGGPKVETVATGLETPWEIAFLPDRRALITERPGRVRLLSRDLKLRPQPVGEVEVAEFGEGGLLGIAVDPRFRRNRFVYLYRTTTGGNDIVRYRVKGVRLVDEAVIATDIDAAAIHDGGRIRFGPDGRLYFATGDAADDDQAQDEGSLNGKVLRMEPEAFRGQGGRPEVVSLGHRNPQGFDWHPRTRRLVASEHGPDGNDEVNVIREGANYGWPEVTGAEDGEFTAPAAVYPETIAPSGASFVTLPGSRWTGDLLIACLLGEQIRRVRLEGTRVAVNEPLLEGDFGRLRTVVEGPDGALFALTSNRDGRGSPREGDDRVLRIVPPSGRP